MKIEDSVYSVSSVYAFFYTFFQPVMRPAFCKSVPAILKKFFLNQWRYSFLPGSIPVTNVEHLLDKKIPFKPSWVTIYIDFVHFWIRMLTFFLLRYKRKVFTQVRDFIYSMGDLYSFAAQVYSKNLSTTKRPFYIRRPRFLVIHLLDPHLMCVPSLHVMVVIHTYLQFGEISKQMGEEEKLKEQLDEMKQGALAISQAILFVKQHSVNCIPAALYGMTCFSPELFPPDEAYKFTRLLFSPPPKPDYEPKRKVHPSFAPRTKLPASDMEEIKNHIISLYNRFLEEGKSVKNWYDPLLKFIRSMDYGSKLFKINDIL